jgi:ABC-type transport system involved in multi-copper enzyme maturation permease subunit
LAALPVGLAVLLSMFASGEQDYSRGFTNTLLDGMLVGAILPIVVMALATAAFGDELDDRTLSYLVLSPVRRSFIVLPKVLATVIIAGPLLVVSGVVATVVGLEGGVRTGLAVGVALLAGVVTYSAVFTWAGLMTSRALAFALIYAVLWEGLISSFFGGVRYLSVRGYTLAIMYGIDESGFEALGPRVIELPAALGGAVGVTVIFFWLTVRRLRRMDVP